MNSTQKNWIWFIAILALIFGAGIYVVNARRVELGDGFSYSMDEYRKVDPSLIQYEELESIVPMMDAPQSLALARGFVCVGDTNGVEVIGQRTIPMDGLVRCLVFDDDASLIAGVEDHVEMILKGGERQVWAAPSSTAFFTSIAADDDFVFVADAGSRCIWRYSKKGGEPLKIESERKFHIPSPYFDIDIGADGSLWAANTGYHAFENIRRDGTPISSWENASFAIEGFSGCCNPAHFALMPDGSFVTAEKGLRRVKIHNLDGSLRCVVAAPDQFDESIQDLAVGGDGRIYVLTEGRVRVFEEKKQ
jgi:hypothetical protein